MGQQRCVVGQDQNRVALAHHRDGSAVPAARIEDEVAGGIDVDEIGHGAVAFRVRFEVMGQRAPRTEVVPLEIAGGHDDILGVL